FSVFSALAVLAGLLRPFGPPGPIGFDEAASPAAESSANTGVVRIERIAAKANAIARLVVFTLMRACMKNSPASRCRLRQTVSLRIAAIKRRAAARAHRAS